MGTLQNAFAVMAGRIVFQNLSENAVLWTQLRKLIKTVSYKTGDFTLASGQKSTFFLDMKKAMYQPEGLFSLAELLAPVLKAYWPDVRQIGGLATGAIPLVVIVSIRSYLEYYAGVPAAEVRRGSVINSFFVRKEVKDHGVPQEIEGCFIPGLPVVLFEDVTTTAGSLLKVVRTVRAQGSEVLGAITVVDRLQGGRENLKAEGIELLSLYTIDDIRHAS